MSFTTDLLSSLGAVSVGVAALYTAVAGLRSYRDGLQVRLVENLLDVEADFERIHDTVAELEDDSLYIQTIKPILIKEKADDRLNADELNTLRRVDRVLRFFYLLRVRTRIMRSEQDLVNVYIYYFHCITEERNRIEMRRYVQEYYRH